MELRVDLWHDLGEGRQNGCFARTTFLLTHHGDDSSQTE